jgi:hypothetical protein
MTNALPLGGLRALVGKSQFTAGEVSPTLHAALDLKRYQSGLAACENMITLYEGGLTRTPGTRFVIALKDEAKPSAPIPFRYSAAERNLLVINAGVARVIQNGGVVESAPGVPYEFLTPWGDGNLPDLRPWQTANTITVACAGIAPKVITRITAAAWSVSSYAPTNGPLDPQNLDQGKTIQASGTTGAVTLTANSGRFALTDVGTVWRLDEPNLSSVPYWKSSETGLVNGDQRRFQGNVYEMTGGTGAAGPTAPTHEEGEWSAGAGNPVWKFLHRGYGFVRVTGFTGPTVVSGTVESRLPNSVVSGATWRWWPSAWSDARGWPAQVSVFQQRLSFMRANTFWDSKPNAPADHESRIASDGAAAADSAIVGRLLSPAGALVDAQWMAASRVKVIGTTDSEWVVRAPNLTEAITAANQLPAEEAHEGSANHIPARVDGGAIYIGRGRERLHYAKFDPLTEQLNPDELTATARHILKGKAAYLAWQRDPNRVLWIGCENGDLIGMTWMQREQVVGFHRHPLAGAYVEWVCALGTSEDAFTEVYLQTRRVINGQTRRYIEMLADYFPINVERADGTGAWYLDCALEYTGVAATTISGLGHLEGCEVHIYANGAMRPKKTVSGGVITLDQPVTQALVGILKEWRVKLLPIEPREPQRDLPKRANHVVLHLLNSAGGWVRVNGGEQEQICPTGALYYGAPVPLFTGSKPVAVPSEENVDIQIEVGGDDAFPFTLLGITVPLEIEGN